MLAKSDVTSGVLAHQALPNHKSKVGPEDEAKFEALQL